MPVISRRYSQKKTQILAEINSMFYSQLGNQLIFKMIEDQVNDKFWASSVFGHRSFYTKPSEYSPLGIIP